MDNKTYKITIDKNHIKLCLQGLKKYHVNNAAYEINDNVITTNRSYIVDIVTETFFDAMHLIEIEMNDKHKKLFSAIENIVNWEDITITAFEEEGIRLLGFGIDLDVVIDILENLYDAAVYSCE